MEEMMKAFGQFEVADAVTVPFLKGLFTQLQVPVPSDEELDAFIKKVETERKEAKPLTDADVRSRDVGNCTYRANAVADGELLKYIDRFEHHAENTKTMWDLFANSAKKFPNNKLFGTHASIADDYTWVDYASVMKRVEAMGSAFALAGLERQSFVGIMLNTCTTWTVLELGLWRQALVPVTLYATFGEEAMEYIINHSGLEVLVAGSEHVATLQKIAPNCPGLKHIIIVNAAEDALKGVQIDNVKIERVEEFEAAGAASILPAREPTAEDLFLVIYTSGTTGNPKGATHSHGAMVSSIAGTSKQMEFFETDIHIAFLPLAHIMEQFLEMMVIAAGGAIGFWSGDVKTLLADVAKLQPTIFVAVPRLLNRIYGSLQAGFNALEGPKRALFDAAMASKRKGLEDGRYLSYWDLIIFKKATMALGGKVRLLATGSAPIDPSLLQFFRIVFSCPVVEGYGMTEALITQITDPRDTRTRSHVGAPAESVEMRLVSVPELNYLTTDNPPRGEICFRGPSILKGYLKDPEKTKEAIDEDGFYHSGDIGLIWPDGQLRIIDRIKHIFKLSQGEYVAPEKVEQTLVQSKYVAQIFVNGDSLKSCLVGVVVPDPDVMAATAKLLGVEDVPSMLSNAEFNKMIVDDLAAVGRACGLKGFELVKSIRLSGQEFSTVGLLTPTFKLKRNIARQHFKAICDELYAAIGE